MKVLLSFFSNLEYFFLCCIITSGHIEFNELNTNIILGSLFKAVKAFLFLFQISEEFKAFFPIEVRHFVIMSPAWREKLTDGTPADPGLFDANDLKRGPSDAHST